MNVKLEVNVIRSVLGETPKIAESAFISEAAYVVGDVEIGENSGVWPGAIIRGDFANIKIGCYTMIEDNSVLHTGRVSMEIGDNVIIAHNAVVHGKISEFSSAACLAFSALLIDAINKRRTERFTVSPPLIACLRSSVSFCLRFASCSI